MTRPLVVQAEQVSYVLLMKLHDHPKYGSKLLLLDKNGEKVHAIHYYQDEIEEEVARDTAQAICAGYGLSGFTTIE